MIDIELIQKSTKLISAKNTALEIEQALIIDELCEELRAAREVVDIADRLAKYIEDENDYRELRQAIKAHEVVGGG